MSRLHKAWGSSLASMCLVPTILDLPPETPGGENQGGAPGAVCTQCSGLSRSPSSYFWLQQRSEHSPAAERNHMAGSLKQFRLMNVPHGSILIIGLILSGLTLPTPNSVPFINPFIPSSSVLAVQETKIPDKFFSEAIASSNLCSHGSEGIR